MGVAMKRSAQVVGLAALLWLLAAAPARAEGSQEVAEVQQCSSGGCGSTDSLSEGDAAAGTIRIKARSSRALGHDWVRLEARAGGGSWVCLRHWSVSASDFSEWYEWSTERWPGVAGAGEGPGGCPWSSLHGQPTQNDEYDLRVVSADDLGDQQPSSIFSIDIVNQAQAPAWSAAPRIEGDTDGEPIVELRWEPNPEPDVVEYHYVRSGPDGDTEFAVSASKPGGQGCERRGSTFVCWDDYFPAEGYAGTYRYTLYAMRSAPQSGERCTLGSGGPCVRSAASGDRTASLKAPPEPTPEADGGGGNANDSSRRRGGRRGSGTSPPPPRSVPIAPNTDYRDFFTGTYEEELPYDRRPVVVPPSGITVTDRTTPTPDEQLALGTATPAEPLDTRRLWRLAALGLLLLAVAAHFGRLVRDR